MPKNKRKKKLNKKCQLEEEMEIKHFSHDHLLKPMVIPSYYFGTTLLGCCETNPYLSDEDNQVMYGCEECYYFIHQACSEIPSDIPHEIHHFYHPDHLLKLCPQQAKQQVHCVACYTTCSYYHYTFTYQCAECPGFVMHIDCALWPDKPELENSSNSIHYRYHGHPLTLHETSTRDDQYCFVCGTSCLGSVYRCDQCYISYHKSCTEIDIPQEIQHYFHPHPLKLSWLTNQRNWWSTCLACHRYVKSFFAFECLECASYMHIDCAFLPNKLKKDGHVDHIHDLSHGHPLSLYEPGKAKCRACREPCGGPTYGCKRCEFFIHESCTRLPHQINHPLHPPHLLTLAFIPPRTRFGNDNLCNGCGAYAEHFLAYSCGECGFLLDVNCGGRNPIIVFEGHNKHVLTLITDGPNLSGDCCCMVCGGEIPHDSSFFTCRHCAAYKLHLLCGPLPCTIKDNCHVDPLKLMNAFVEDYNETDEVYCDTCEQLRDPNEPVYYCKECNFITEIKCVMSEVLRCLEGHHGNVKLRTANKTKIWHNGQVFSFHCANIMEEDDLAIETEKEMKYIQEKYFEVKLDVSYKGLDFFTIGESVQILKIFQEAGALYSQSETVSETMENTDFSWSKLISSIKTQGLGSLSSYVIGEAQSELVPSYSNEALRNLMDELDSVYIDPDFLSMLDIGANIVMIGELMIMQEFASCLKGLLHTHGDFTKSSTLSPRLKMFFLNLFCNVVPTMCITKVREVDKTMLRKWWKLLKIVKHAGFEIQFMMERLSKITRALFGKQVRESFAKTNSQIDDAYDEVKELEAKLEAKKRDIEAFKLEQASIKKAMEYERTPEMKECLEDEEALKWKMVWEGSLIMFQKFHE